jgi:transcription antitermination factor NusG
LSSSFSHAVPQTASTGFQLESAELHWFAVQTRPRHEKKVAQELQAKGILPYLPLHASLHRWSDRLQSVSLPLFPGYVFVRTGASVHDRVAVLQTNGITGFVGVRGQGISIPDQQIQAIQAVIQSGVSIGQYPFLQEGTRVRIRSGSLAGVEGLLVAKNEDLSLVISVELIQRSLAVRISGFHVEPV